MRGLKRFCAYLTTLVFLAFIAGCDSSSPDIENPPPSLEAATLVLGITDAPIDDAKSVIITITRIEISKDGEGWEEYFNANNEGEEEKKVDLLEYSKGKVFLFDGQEFNAGEYGQIRLYLSESPEKNTITLLNDTIHYLDINLGIRNNGVKLVSGFEIKEGVTTSLTIDFDVRKSIVVKTPNTDPTYSLKPTLKLITNDVAGNTVVIEPLVVAVEEVYFLYPADFDISNENTESDAESDDTLVAYEHSVSSAIAFVDGILKVTFPFIHYGSYDFYRMNPSSTELELRKENITLSADDNGEVIISE
jgi:hypothetical protein